MAIKAHFARIYMRATTETTIRVLYPKYIMKKKFASGREIDIVEHREYIAELKRIKDEKTHFVILYNELLDYKINLACQTTICLYRDLRKKIIFDSSNLYLNNHANYLYLMILPFENSTRILFYMNNKHIGNNKDFIEDFSLLNSEEKLHVIFIIIIMYTEQFYMNPDFKNLLIKDNKIIRLFKKCDSDFSYISVFNRITKYKKYKNYLSREFN